MAKRRTGFTLVELLVVIGIIALLIGILLPTLGKARRKADAIKCMSNLKQLAAATAMYLNDSKNLLPYPTTTLGEQTLWFNVLDPYLALQVNGDRTGVAGGRSYTPYKQCIVYEQFEGGKVSGGQDNLKEFSRTYKMNSHLRGYGPARQASAVRISAPSETVYLGDATSLDITSLIPGQWENGQFSFEVNDKTQAGPALRHDGAANILFVDGHVETVRLKTFTKNLRPPHHAFTCETWESEFVNSAGVPTDLISNTKSLEEQGLKRNPMMPLRWSTPGLYYRP